MGDTRLDFLTKEPVSGELLSARLAGGPLSTEEAVRCAIGIGSALHKIHARGLVHGALSPYCIALEAGGARILESTPSPEDCAAYRSPEQVRGEEPDVRSDVFAYGALVYEIACGKRAFPGDGAELSQRILTATCLCRCRQARRSCRRVEGVVAGCLQKDPALRRQRVQNAVTELKLAAREPAPHGRGSAARDQRPAGSGAASRAAAACGPRLRTVRRSSVPPPPFGRRCPRSRPTPRRTSKPATVSA